jgi:Cupin-like domain
LILKIDETNKPKTTNTSKGKGTTRHCNSIILTMADQIRTTRRNDSSNRDDDETAHPLVVTTEALESYCEDVAYLWTRSHTIPVLEVPPSPLQFLRDHVAMSRPCIIRNTILCNGKGAEQAEEQQQQQPLTLSLDELVELADPNLLLTVDVTPDGHGDCLRMVKQQQQQQQQPATSGRDGDEESSILAMFVKPQEQQLTLSEFRTLLRASQRHGWQQCVKSSNTGGGGDGSDSLAAIQYRVFPSAPPPDGSSCASETNITNDDNKSEDDRLSASSVYYYSRQNDCLRTELGSLWEEQQGILFPHGFSWAAQAFGSSENDDDAASLTNLMQPDAVNFWIGNERAVSAMHKDHYENLFYVLHGEKVFTLCPPGDAPFLYEGEYPSGRFQQRDGEHDVSRHDWSVRIDPPVDGTTAPSTVHWITANVMDDVRDENDCHRRPSRRRFPLLRHAHPVQVRVQAGEMLYLPSLWFHQVTQTCETVAVNYWYDMKFNSPLWCYFHLLSQLKAPPAPKTIPTNDTQEQEQTPVSS